MTPHCDELDENNINPVSVNITMADNKYNASYWNNIYGVIELGTYIGTIY